MRVAPDGSKYWGASVPDCLVPCEFVDHKLMLISLAYPNFGKGRAGARLRRRTKSNKFRNDRQTQTDRQTDRLDSRIADAQHKIQTQNPNRVGKCNNCYNNLPFMTGVILGRQMLPNAVQVQV